MRLKESLPNTRYIDLAEGSETVDFDNHVLLIDNAQLLTNGIKCGAIREKIVIAAFSPGAKMTAGKKALSKWCGDGNDSLFNWRPFMYNEVQCLASNLGFTVALKTDFKQKQISERRLKVIFCKTNGNPRYITRYFDEENLGYMHNSLDDQYQSILSVDGLGGPEKICQSLVALLQTSVCQLWQTPSVIGAAYCTNATGIGNWKISHSYYGFRAVEYLGGEGGWGVPSTGVRGGNNLRA